MAVKFILMMALVIIGTAFPGPDPDPDINIDVKQIVDVRCGGGCCDDKCCTFDGEIYRSGYNIEVGCVKFCCRQGEWEYKGIDKDCGNCTVGGEPLVYTFGNTIPFNIRATSTFILTQKFPHFGVFSEFSFCRHDGVFGSYVNSVIYYEGGLPDTITVYCGTLGTPTTCKLLVSVESRGTWAEAVPPFPGIQYGLPAGIWVFKLGTCIIIVGTVGLTVVVCPNVPSPLGAPYSAFPWVYIYAPQRWKNQLFGLCNTFTSEQSSVYIASDGSEYNTVNTSQYGGPFINSWKVYNTSGMSTVNTP